MLDEQDAPVISQADHGPPGKDLRHAPPQGKPRAWVIIETGVVPFGAQDNRAQIAPVAQCGQRCDMGAVSG